MKVVKKIKVQDLELSCRYQSRDLDPSPWFAKKFGMWCLEGEKMKKDQEHRDRKNSEGSREEEGTLKLGLVRLWIETVGCCLGEELEFMTVDFKHPGS